MLSKKSSSKVKIGSFLRRRKDSVEIKDSLNYKRITIKTKHQGIFLRDEIKGSQIGTKFQFEVKSGQFLLSKIDARLGAFGIVPDFLDKAIITGNFWTFDVDKSKINVDWLNLFTSSASFYKICDRASSGTTHRKYLDESEFLSLEIELPQISEQNAFLGSFDVYQKYFLQLKHEITGQQKYLQQLRRTILQEAIQGKLTKQDPTDEPASKLLERIKKEKQQLIIESKLKREKVLPPLAEEQIPFALPNGWIWCRFQEIAIILSNLVDPIKYPELVQVAPDAIEKGTGKLLEKRTVKQAGVKSSNHYFSANRIIYSKIRPNLSKAIIADFEGLCSADMYPIQALINIEYLLLFILSNTFLFQVVKSDNRVKMPKINQEELNEVIIPLPPLQEQQRIVLKAQKTIQKIELLQEHIHEIQTQMQQLFQTVLSEVFENASSATADVFH